MNCDLCIDNFFIRDDNCYEIHNCFYNYYYDENLNLKCINRDTHCPDFKPFEDKKTKECIQKCNINEFNTKCNPTNNIISIKDTYKKIFDNIKFLKLEEKLFKNREKYVIFGNNVTFIFSTSEIEKEDLYTNYNTSSIILGESEKYFKKLYSLNTELPISILKIETLNNHSNNFELYYELFNPLNLSQKLDLNIVSENYIKIIIPKIFKPYKMDLILKTRELGYNIFDLNDSFYTDICSVFTYNNSDFSLSERKNIIDLSDENLCLIGCNYSSYDIKTLRTICLCKIGFNENYIISDIINDDINTEKNNLANLIKNNMDISKSSNFKVVKCFSIIFRKNLISKNYGFYIMFFLLLFNIITLIYSPFSKIEKSFNKYCNEILCQMKEIYKNNNYEELETKGIIDNKDLKNGKSHKKENKKLNQILNIIRHIGINIDNKIKKIKKVRSKKLYQNIQNINLIEVNNSCDVKSNLSFNNDKSNNFFFQLDKDKNEEQEFIQKLKEKKNSDYYIYFVIKNIEPEKRKTYLSENEMNHLSYENALKIEDRNKSNYYLALLKEKNKIISICLNDKDYNIQSIKISTFFFDFGLSLTINALFYNDETIYQINQDEGHYNLKTQYSRVIYSAIISGLLNFIVELLALSQANILSLRNYKEIIEVENEITKLIKKLKVKCIIYYVILIFLNIIFFYYISAFCAIYTIIQTHMISDSLISFLLTMSYSLILSLISSIVRIFSLEKKNQLGHFLYFISSIISLF